LFGASTQSRRRNAVSGRMTSVAAGARVETDIWTEVWGKIIVLADPFGHGFCLIEFLGRDYDEISDPSGLHS
jgi:hypothetical protein